MNAERLKLAGLAIGVENAVSSDPSMLRIEQSEDSVIYAGTRAGMALAICVRITVLKSGITIRDYEITIPACSANIFLVEPPEGSLVYRVLGWLDLPRDVVLNHRIFSGRPLPLDSNLDGFLVAQSFDPLPSQFQSGMPTKIRFADQLGNFFMSEVRLSVARCKQSGIRPKGNGLFEPTQVTRLVTGSRPGAERSAPETDGWNRIGKKQRGPTIPSHM